MKISRRALLKRLPLAALAGGFFINVRAQSAKQIWVTGNPSIDKPREIALSLLKPTQAQIERAWELHFSSVVFESYGFAPRFAVDGEAFNQAVKAGRSRDELEDLREAMTMNRGAVNERERTEFFDAFRGGGDRWEHLWPKDNFETAPAMEQSVAWTNWPLFTLGMVMRGHSDDAIRQVLGGNVLRVLQANTHA